jgi:Mitochondrial ribosomal protein (VAR1)
MLNILKLKFKNRYKTIGINAKNLIVKNKEFVPNIRNWKDSIYTYNKNTLSLIPAARKLTIKLIKAYFNLYKLKLEKKLRRKKILRLRLRRISTHKIFISDSQLKHTNDKINITIYFYNRQLSNYLYKISKRFKKVFSKFIFEKKLLLIKKKGFNLIQKQTRYKNVVIKALALNNKINKIFNTKSIEYYENKYYKQFIKKSFKRIKLYIFYKQLVYINKSKFNNSYLQGLINLIKKIYNKNIQFNLINVKYFYFNSDIFTQSLVLKLRKNRRKLLRYLKSCISKTNIENIKVNYTSKYIFNNLNKYNDNIDTTNKLLYNLLLQNKTKSISIYLKKNIFNNIRYKRVSGIRIQATGRLTKRYTASRSISKLRYKGNLINFNSSIKGNPSVLLRGNFRPNLQFSKLNSKTRIGSFGIKGWISGI